MTLHDGKSLVRRVGHEEQAAIEQGVTPADEIADELRTAWAAVYGRHRNPSDAWDHAIKAVELSLWQIVTPDKVNSTSGDHRPPPAAGRPLQLLTGDLQ